MVWQHSSSFCRTIYIWIAQIAISIFISHATNSNSQAPLLQNQSDQQEESSFKPRGSVESIKSCVEGAVGCRWAKNTDGDCEKFEKRKNEKLVRKIVVSVKQGQSDLGWGRNLPKYFAMRKRVIRWKPELLIPVRTNKPLMIYIILNI